MNMSKKKLSLIMGGVSIMAFCLGLYIDAFSLNQPAGLKTGKYAWDYDKIVASMDQELIICPDSGYFLMPEAFQEPNWFKIDGDQLVVNDTIALDYYITEDGIGVIWTPTIHQMWKFIE